MLKESHVNLGITIAIFVIVLLGGAYAYGSLNTKVDYNTRQLDSLDELRIEIHDIDRRLATVEGYISNINGSL